jgi:hypothetical protein
MLFLLYINDLPINIQGTKVVLFADDINMLVMAEEGKALQHKTIRLLKSFIHCFTQTV